MVGPAGRQVDTRNPHIGDGDFERARDWLRNTLLTAGVSARVVEAMLRVRREEFVLASERAYAYDDWSMAIGHRQAISQPSLVARMIDELRTEPDHAVLDVGTGSGYQAAVLSGLAERVVTVERVPQLTEQARLLLARLGYGNVETHQAGEELGWPEDAPYDGIIVGAGAPSLPRSLVEQLVVGGRMVIPVGPAAQQEVRVVVRTQSGFETRASEPVRFVPLIGKGAWRG